MGNLNIATGRGVCRESVGASDLNIRSIRSAQSVARMPEFFSNLDLKKV